VQVEFKDINAVTREVTITVEAERVEKAYQKSLMKAARGIQVPGFRKGKAPLSMVERMHGDAIMDYFQKDMVDEAFDEAAKEHDIRYLLVPEVKDLKWERGSDMQIVIEIEHEPELELQIAESLRVPYNPIQLEDEVDKFLNEIAKEHARVIEVETAMANDMLECEITLEPDTRNETHTATLFAGTQLPSRSFEELVDKKTGDVLDMLIPGNTLKLVTKQSLAGIDNDSTYPCRVMVNSVSRYTTPAIDDDFAKDNDHENLEEMKEQIRKDMGPMVEQRNIAGQNNAIIHKLYTDNQFDIPVKTVERLAEQQAEEIPNPDYRKFYAYQYKMQFAQEMISIYIMKALVKQMPMEPDEVITAEYIRHEAILSDMTEAAFTEKNKERVEAPDFQDEVRRYMILRSLAARSEFFVPEPEEPAASEDDTANETGEEQ